MQSNIPKPEPGKPSGMVTGKKPSTMVEALFKISREEMFQIISCLSM